MAGPLSGWSRRLKVLTVVIAIAGGVGIAWSVDQVFEAAEASTPVVGSP